VTATEQTDIRAVIPAAGLGSRMLPVTKGVPKEMLPAGRKPLIQHVVEEAVASGIREICVVIRAGKEVIRDYFLLRQPEARKRGRDIEELEALVARCELTFVYQQETRGLGDALLQAKDFVGRDSFVMMIPDQLARATTPATLQLLRSRTSSAAVCSSLVRLPKEEARFFPGARGFEFERVGASEPLRMGRLLSEEEMREAYREVDYEIRGFGRTLYPPEIFDYLGRDFTNPETGEVDLSRTFETLTERLAHRGVLLAGEFFDVGTFEGYYRSLPRMWGEGL
jgi:UTP--glucose-1-phosphate uridylyltransferase